MKFFNAIVGKGKETDVAGECGLGERNGQRRGH